MQKIPTLYRRDYTTTPPTLTTQVTPGCEWVLAGEGHATRKWDGVCTRRTSDGLWWARREIKPGKPIPPNFIQATHDDATGKTYGWEPIGQSPFSKFHRNAIALNGEPVSAGETFELIGPRINGNPERIDRHRLMPHAEAPWIGLPDLTYDTIRDVVLAKHYQGGMEGLVWHHPDGRMCKIKARDFAATTEAAA